MTTPHDAPPPRPPFRWTRWSGPGLALLLLTGAATYAVFSHLTPASVPALPSEPAAAAPRSPQNPAEAARPALGSARGTLPSAPAVPGASPAGTALMPDAAAGVAPGSTGPEPTMVQRREEVRQAATHYRKGRFNAFFREEKFMEEFAQGGPARILAMREELADPTPLEELPANTQFMYGKPEAVLDRMSMIDMLHTMAPQNPGAREAMVSLLMEPVDPTLSEVAKKGVVGEKYDLLFRLAQLDRQLAVNSYTQLGHPKLKTLLREALIAGLAESGATMDEMKQLTRHL